MRLIPITDRTACIDGVTMTAVYLLPDGGCILIDPGHPCDGEALDALLIKEKLPVRGVLSTHMHHDHFGNCRLFAKKYGLPVILPAGEVAGCRSAEALSAALGFRSSYRVRQSKTLSSTLGPVDETIGFAQTSVTVAGAEFEVLHTPGHTVDCVCFRTPDNVLVVGDVLSSEDVLATLRAPYTGCIAQDLTAKRAVGADSCSWCVLAHRGFVSGRELPALAEKNIAVVESVVNTVRGILTQPMSIDEIIPLFCEARGIYGPTPLHGMQLRHVVGAVLGYLLDRGEAVPETRRGLTHFIPADGTPPGGDEAKWDGSEVQGSENSEK